MTEREQDIHRLWRSQPREEQEMSIDAIRSRAERFDRRVRRWNIVGGVLLVVLIIIEALQVWFGDRLLERVGDGLTMAALAYVAYRVRLYMDHESMPAGLGRTASVEFYRRQLVRQRDLARRPWRLLVLFIPGVALSLFNDALERPPVQTAAIAVGGVALFLAVAWWQTRTARKLQREMDELG